MSNGLNCQLLYLAHKLNKWQEQGFYRVRDSEFVLSTKRST